MDTLTVAPCGVICELCIAYQRTKNSCVGCNSAGYKPKHCTICSIKLCKEKPEPISLCLECEKFPCRRLKDLEKRYVTRYGESINENMRLWRDRGAVKSTEQIRLKWTCRVCGHLLSVHRATCIFCSTPNPHYPGNSIPCGKTEVLPKE